VVEKRRIWWLEVTEKLSYDRFMFGFYREAGSECLVVVTSLDNALRA